ncbi:unnamed protein product [Nesidiocoris tenuis]|uniref:Uncharacterized protein n=1 Tax=Nesidiocoris tenuis TaxID=355587 RepID=A0A6H5GLG6_9HEMI|nr:unnamed protein product [Nesidiocoris tenuis]
MRAKGVSVLIAAALDKRGEILMAFGTVSKNDKLPCLYWCILCKRNRSQRLELGPPAACVNLDCERSHFQTSSRIMRHWDSPQTRITNWRLCWTKRTNFTSTTTYLEIVCTLTQGTATITTDQ